MCLHVPRRLALNRPLSAGPQSIRRALSRSPAMKKAGAFFPAITMIETGTTSGRSGSEPSPQTAARELPRCQPPSSSPAFGMTGRRDCRPRSAFSGGGAGFSNHRAEQLARTDPLIAAPVWMANSGMIEKGRSWKSKRSTFRSSRSRPDFLAELVAATPVAVAGPDCALDFSRTRSARERPVHLFFFYAVVIAVLYRDGELGKLLSIAHLAGLLIMLGIFAAWAVPYWQAMKGARRSPKPGRCN